MYIYIYIYTYIYIYIYIYILYLCFAVALPLCTHLTPVILLYWNIYTYTPDLLLLYSRFSSCVCVWVSVCVCVHECMYIYYLCFTPALLIIYNVFIICIYLCLTPVVLTHAFLLNTFSYIYMLYFCFTSALPLSICLTDVILLYWNIYISNWFEEDGLGRARSTNVCSHISESMFA